MIRYDVVYRWGDDIIYENFRTIRSARRFIRGKGDSVISLYRYILKRNGKNHTKLLKTSNNKVA